MPLLELKNVASYYGSVQALKSVSLRVEQGEVVTLLGANGAGKSTTLRTISGLLRPASGEVWFQGQPIHDMAPEKIVRLGISHVPEGRRRTSHPRVPSRLGGQTPSASFILPLSPFIFHPAGFSGAFRLRLPPPPSQPTMPFGRHTPVRPNTAGDRHGRL